VLSVWTAFRAEGRRRWASWLAIAALIAIVGGTVLTGASAARRTDAAYPGFLSQYGYDAEAYSSALTIPSKVLHLPNVKSVRQEPFYVTGNISVDGQLVPSNDLTIVGLPSDPTSDLVKLVTGRLPSAPDEAAVGYAMQQQYHLHVGSTIPVPLYTLAQRREVLENTTGTPTPFGPTIRLHVVGVVAGVSDFPTSVPMYTLYVGRGFEDTFGRHTVAASLGFMRLVHGAADVPRLTYDVNHVPVSGGFVGVQALSAFIGATEGSIRPQATGWWLFALFALLAGLALVGQALSRQSIEEREAYPSLSAIGYRPVQLFGIGMARAVAVGVVGALGALLVTTALSPATPVGEARVAEPQHGVVVDPVVFGLGGLAVVVTVLLLGALPAWRAAQVKRLRQRRDQAVGHGTSRVVGALARTGAPPSVLVGVRHALERGRGRTSVPVATALVGTAAAIVALVAASVFGASLSTLVSTPRLYGQDVQIAMSGFSGQFAKSVGARLQDDPEVTGVTAALIGKYVTVNHVSVSSIIALPLKGPMVFSLIQGHDPSGAGEIALGTQTMRSAGVHVGSIATVSVITPSGATRTGAFRVVGSMAFPPVLSTGGGLGVGAVIPLSGVQSFLCPPGPVQTECNFNHKIYNPSFTNWGVAIRVAPGAAGRATVASLERRYALFLSVLTVPTNLVNFGQAVNFPALLGITLAVFGAATLAHLLLVSASRRRREFALLKVLGFVRRQIRVSVSWQATTVAAVGIVVGIPLGIVVGNLAWQAFASNLGAVPLTVVPVGLVALVGGGALLLGNLLAVGPASFAARARPAAALREE
jgi:FtsX-like permease family